MAQKANAYGGKRPPKEESKEPPLEPHELFDAWEMLEAHLPMYVPPEMRTAEALAQRQEQQQEARGCDWLTPEQAEDIMRACEDAVFINDPHGDYLEIPLEGDFENPSFTVRGLESRWMNRLYQGSRFNPELFFALILAWDYESIEFTARAFKRSE